MILEVIKVFFTVGESNPYEGFVPRISLPQSEFDIINSIGNGTIISGDEKTSFGDQFETVLPLSLFEKVANRGVIYAEPLGGKENAVTSINYGNSWGLYRTEQYILMEPTPPKIADFKVCIDSGMTKTIAIGKTRWDYEPYADPVAFPSWPIMGYGTYYFIPVFFHITDAESKAIKVKFFTVFYAFNTKQHYISWNTTGDILGTYAGNVIDAVPVDTTTDPYKPGGEIEPGGGEGDFDNTSDPIDFPPMPTLSAVDTGFLTLFNPSLAQLQELSRYMWSDLFDVEGWKKLFANPMDAILGLTIVPVAVPEAGTGVVSVGNISTGISMTKAAGQYVDVDCGTLNVNEYWGAYLDYDPYTKAEIYLPFIGIHALSTDDIMKKPVHVKYRIDLLSGACCAYVKCGDSVLYSFVGQCSSAVPTTSSDWTNIINGALSIAGSIGSMVATGGASAPMAAGAIASAAVNSLKPNIEKSGSMGGMGGMLGVQQPYIILTRPRQALPLKLSSYTGYPSFMTKVLGDLSGFTIVDSIHLENIPATGAELSEIEALLKEGVIL